jgi:hypothetical protein
MAPVRKDKLRQHLTGDTLDANFDFRFLSKE